MFRMVAFALAGLPSALCVQPELRPASRRRYFRFRERFPFTRRTSTLGEDLGIQPDRRVRTASTIKLPIMVGVFAVVQHGKANDLHMMFVVSDETATNLVLDRVPADL